MVSSLPDLISKGEDVRKIRVNGVGTDDLTDKILGGQLQIVFPLFFHVLTHLLQVLVVGAHVETS